MPHPFPSHRGYHLRSYRGSSPATRGADSLTQNSTGTNSVAGNYWVGTATSSSKKPPSGSRETPPPHPCPRPRLELQRELRILSLDTVCSSFYPDQGWWGWKGRSRMGVRGSQEEPKQSGSPKARTQVARSWCTRITHMHTHTPRRSVPQLLCQLAIGREEERRWGSGQARSY